MNKEKIIKGVYCLTFPNGKRYVGIGLSESGINRRWNSYKKLKCKDQTKLYYALKKYGPENVKFEVVLETNDIENAKRSEMYLIDVWNLQDSNFGYNILPGGDCSHLGVKRSKEFCEKMSHLQTGKKHSSEHKNNQSKGLKAYYSSSQSDKTKELIKKIHTGKIISLTTREKMSSCKKGKPLSKEHIQSIKKAKIGMKYPNRGKNSRQARINQAEATAKNIYYFDDIEVRNFSLYCEENNLNGHSIQQTFYRVKKDEIIYKNIIIKRVKI